MKKKVLSLLLVGAMAASMAVGCGGNWNGDSQSSNNSQPSSQAGNDSQSGNDSQAGNDSQSGGNQLDDYGTGEVKIWVPDASVEATQELVNQFFAAHPEMSGYTASIEPMGEGDAAGNMISDVEAGADIFGFAQDQMARLVAAGSIASLGGDYATFVKDSNDADSVAAASVGDAIYAFPITADNGYFLYYDKSVISDPSTLEGIVADCEAAGKNFYFDTGSWYQTAFFFGAGCKLTFETDVDGAFTSVNVDYASENGVKALKAMRTLGDSKCYMDGSSIGDAVNWAAIVDGTWDSTKAKEILGENYACAKLPTVTVDGDTFQLSGFKGFKLMGVKPQSEPAKLVVCMELAKFLSDKDAQLVRYNKLGWGPSNLEAQKDEAVVADEALTAIREQFKYTIPQGQYPGDYWTQGDALGESVVGADFDSYTDEQLMDELKAFQSKMESLVQ